MRSPSTETKAGAPVSTATAPKLCALAVAMLLPVAAPVLADPCSEVVEDTLAELRAGASGSWTADQEQLIRSAAGSACVKAVSGRYNSAPLPAAVPAVEAAAGADPAPAPAAAKAEEADDGSWTAGGLTFRSLSGSPAKKPYERQRDQKKDD